MIKLKEQLLFLDPVDEATFFDSLAAAVADVRLISGVQWPSEVPPVVAGPSQSGEHVVLLWSPAVRPALPSRARGDHFDGPQTAWVIQWVRSTISADGELRSGRLAASWDSTDKAMSDFVNATWKALRGVTTNRLVRADGVPDTDYRVGKSAAESGRAGAITLRDGSVPLYFTVP